MESIAQSLKSFIKVPSNSHFPIQNIPFGVFYPKSATLKKPRCGTIVGNTVVDLSYLESKDYFKRLFGDMAIFSLPYLNKFMSLESSIWKEARAVIQNLLSETSSLKENDEFHSKALFDSQDVVLCLPAQIGDFTDFNSSKYHSYNMGQLIRGYKNLQQNWLRLPIGYHGRSSSLVVSGKEIHRPRGQIKCTDKEDSIFSETKKLDFELEIGVFLGGKTNQLGIPIKTSHAYDNIFGFVLLNDWSARDMQTWEYVPLGPLTSKNYATTISPWIVTHEAVKEFRVTLPPQDLDPLPYLKDEKMWGYDIEVEALIKTSKSNEYQSLCNSNYKHLYWSISQQIAHHTVSGCNMMPGDLIGSGALSGPENGQYGTMIELSWNGQKPVKLDTGEERKFVEDGDSILLTGYCKSKNDYIIGFGECEGKILPALDLSYYNQFLRVFVVFTLYYRNSHIDNTSRADETESLNLQQLILIRSLLFELYIYYNLEQMKQRLNILKQGSINQQLREIEYKLCLMSHIC